jgi:hypothetical protein
VFLGTLAKDHDDLADVLHRRGAGRPADLAEEPVALVAIDSHEANLDQLVRIERALNFHEHGRCKARIADQDDRSERMGTRFQYLALGGSQWV